MGRHHRPEDAASAVQQYEYLFLVVPLLACYVGLMAWSCICDRWKR